MAAQKNVIKNVFLVIIIILTFIMGCTSTEPMPKIVETDNPGSYDFHTLDKNTSWSQPSDSVPHSWIPDSSIERDWTAIIIHHSATESGNAAIFDKWHREVNHWDGVGYDFVIGNGSESGNGQIEVTFRWKQQKTGAHCGGTENNWANRKAIGICLVGNFNKSYPSEAQINSLRKLVQFLIDRYDIPKSRIFGHGNTPQARATDCPGKNFPLDRFISSLR